MNCNSNGICGFGGNKWWWIIILILIVSCSGGSWGCGNNNCGCC